MTAPKPQSPKNQFSDITLAQAERAIYIDFEGFTDKAPSLIGGQSSASKLMQRTTM
jgi:hypothetical protein